MDPPTRNNLSISFTDEDSERVQGFDTVAAVRTPSNVTMNIQTIDVSYTMGGMTLAVSSSETDNATYTDGDKVNENIVAMSLAF